jgi:hypothetical protein
MKRVVTLCLTFLWFNQCLTKICWKECTPQNIIKVSSWVFNLVKIILLSSTKQISIIVLVSNLCVHLCPRNNIHYTQTKQTKQCHLVYKIHKPYLVMGHCNWSHGIGTLAFSIVCQINFCAGVSRDMIESVFLNKKVSYCYGYDTAWFLLIARFLGTIIAYISLRLWE